MKTIVRQNFSRSLMLQF